MAQKVYNGNENLRDFVNKSISMKEVPIFELNQFILAYPATELILLQIRAENDFISKGFCLCKRIQSFEPEKVQQE